MPLSIRIFLIYVVLICAAAALFYRDVVDRLPTVISQVVEESLVDTANLLAELVGENWHMTGNGLETTGQAFSRFNHRVLEANIWGLKKRNPDLVVYVTDREGTVLFHSTNKDIGADYSKWNDVYLTLRGEYGARSTRVDKDDPDSAVMYVAAPIEVNGQLEGVLTVSKPRRSSLPYFELARRSIGAQALLLGIVAALLSALVAWGITRPARLLMNHANQVSQGKSQPMPRVRGKEMSQLASSIETMRRELEGKAYVEQYVQNMTHEMKSPLSAITAAAELLEEDLSPRDRQKFIHNIQFESGRLEQLIKRLLELTSIEKKEQLQHEDSFRLSELIDEPFTAAELKAGERGICIDNKISIDASLKGDFLLLRQAIENLLLNAIDFSQSGDTVILHSGIEKNRLKIAVIDTGEGIPGFALPRVQERFYSLPRPGTGKKGTGIGLSMVKEVCRLHHGHFEIENRSEGGVSATISLPIG